MFPGYWANCSKFLEEDWVKGMNKQKDVLFAADACHKHAGKRLSTLSGKWLLESWSDLTWALATQLGDQLLLADEHQQKQPKNIPKHHPLPTTLQERYDTTHPTPATACIRGTKAGNPEALGQSDTSHLPQRNTRVAACIHAWEAERLSENECLRVHWKGWPQSEGN